MHSLADQSVRGAASYAEACARHAWKIPGFYNMAWDICDRHADGSGRTALIWETGDGSGQLSFDELKRRSDALAAALARLGVAPGARAALMLPQTVEHALAHLAIFKCHAISVPLSRLFGPDALRYRLSDSEASVLLTDEENLPKVLEIWDALPWLRHVILCPGEISRAPDSRVHSFARLLREVTGAPPPLATRADDAGLLIYTSGTTGPPKGALHTHRYLLGYNGVDYANNFFRPGDVYWSPADWAWVGGLLVGLFCPFAHGVPVVASTTRFDPVGSFELMARWGVTNTLLSATALRKMSVAWTSRAASGSGFDACSAGARR